MTIADSRTTTLAGRMRAARLFAGIEQIDLAKALGCSRTSISNWENGKTEIPARVMIHWAELTEVSVDYLAWGNRKAPDSVESGASGVVRPKGFEPLAFCSVAQPDALAPYLAAFALVSAAIRGVSA
jgi:transcriptional regulator with XRE-family HTH domain